MENGKSSFKRHIEPIVGEALESARVVFISGARQVGKTTIARQIAERRKGVYFTLDNRDTLNAALSDASGFLGGIPQPQLVVIDEVQKCPDLLPAIKLTVDQEPRPGKFLLTGSTHLFSTRGIDESLAGRMERIEMLPLSRGEISGIGSDAVVPAAACMA